MLSVSEPKEPNTREFTRGCALELYFGGLVVAWWWSRCGVGAMPTALKTRKWEEGFFSIRFLFKFDGFGAFWGSVRGWGALGIGWGARSTHKRTNIQTHKHRNMYLYTNIHIYIYTYIHIHVSPVALYTRFIGLELCL